MKTGCQIAAELLTKYNRALGVYRRCVDEAASSSSALGSIVRKDVESQLDVSKLDMQGCSRAMHRHQLEHGCDIEMIF
jgi:hypothetical protein